MAPLAGSSTEPAKPNFTAWFVLQGTLAAMHHPDFRDAANDGTLAWYRALSNAASRTRLASRIVSSLPYAWQYRIGELVTNPGRLRHFYFRKKEIEKQARALLDGGGITQVVLLGAGLDVLSLQLASEYPGVRFIEIDTGESQAFKTASFAAGRVVPPGNVEFIDGDLRHPLTGILTKSQHYETVAPTLWIAEGFFMFIPEDSVVRIFREIRGLSAAGSHVIFTSLSSRKITSAVGHLIQMLYLHKEKSPFEWVLPFADFGVFMQKLGYQMVWQMESAALHKSYMQHKFNGNHTIGDNIHIARTQNV